MTEYGLSLLRSVCYLYGYACHSNQAGVLSASSIEGDLCVMQGIFICARYSAAARLMPKLRCRRLMLLSLVQSLDERQHALHRLSLCPLSLGHPNPLRPLRRKRWLEPSQSSPINSPPSRWCQMMSCAGMALRLSAICCARNLASPGRSSRRVRPVARSFAVSTSTACGFSGGRRRRQRRIRSRRRPFCAGRPPHERPSGGNPRARYITVRFASNRRGR